MSDSTTDPVAAAPAGPTTAGRLLRQARQAQGLHIAALAAAIKVVPKKLEALEADQFDQLPDATFTRALANTVCRTLKIDPAPVLALLPPLPGQNRLEHVAEGLKTPFEEGDAGGSSSAGESMLVSAPVLWLAGILIIAAVAVYTVPSSWLKWRPGAVATGSGAASSASADGATVPAGTVVENQSTAAGASTTAATPAAAPAHTEPGMPPGSDAPAASPEADAAQAAASGAAAAAEASAGAKLLQISPSDASWVEVVDARGKTLLSRLVQADEHVELDGALPFKIKIGNASATQVAFRGQPLDLGPYTRDNIAKLQLK